MESAGIGEKTNRVTEVSDHACNITRNFASEDIVKNRKTFLSPGSNQIQPESFWMQTESSI